METINTAGKTALDFLREIDQQGRIIAEYIWIDGDLGVRSKARTLPRKVTSLDQLPEWNYDGSSCYQAVTENSEVIIKPVFFFPDPFRLGDNICVLCEGFVWADKNFTRQKPVNTNFRHAAVKIFESARGEEPWYGVEQEYTLLQSQNRFTTRPYGWPSSGYPGAQGPYYCAAGGNVAFGRTVADAHYKCCLYAGLKVSGINAEVMPGQWEFQIGPATGVEAGDHTWAARYLLQRCAEDYNLSVSFEPKLFPDWNGSGCHTNFSTKIMRKGSQGMKYIEDMMVKFSAKHALHLKMYGEGNNKRLTGIHETSSFTKFSYGPGNRAASFRIPSSTYAAGGKGYIEDRRPSSNIDPYVVTAIILDTACVDELESAAPELVKHYSDWRLWNANEDIPRETQCKIATQCSEIRFN